MLKEGLVSIWELHMNLVPILLSTLSYFDSDFFKREFVSVLEIGPQKSYSNLVIMYTYRLKEYLK